MSATQIAQPLPTAEQVMVQAKTENFPVASWLLGPRLRRHFLALYGFARLVDDVGDEVVGDRVQLLDRIERELDAPQHPIMRTLAVTVGECRLPREPFLRLIEANRRDQIVTRYDTIDDLLDYCHLSAAPVGALVLHVLNAATPERVALSDQICAALQIIEHLQDVDEDLSKGRVYIGQFDAVGEAHSLLQSGPPLTKQLRGRARLAVAGFLAGGRHALSAIEGTQTSFVHEYLKAVVGR